MDAEEENMQSPQLNNEELEGLEQEVEQKERLQSQNGLWMGSKLD